MGNLGSWGFLGNAGHMPAAIILDWLIAANLWKKVPSAWGWCNATILEACVAIPRYKKLALMVGFPATVFTERH